MMMMIWRRLQSACDPDITNTIRLVANLKINNQDKKIENTIPDVDLKTNIINYFL